MERNVITYRTFLPVSYTHLKAIKGAREEQIQAAYEMWQKAQAGVTIAEKSYQRVKNLYEQGVMPAQKLDEVTAQRDASIATEKAAKAQYTMAKNGAEREDKMAAEALVNRAKGAVAEVCLLYTSRHRREERNLQRNDSTNHPSGRLQHKGSETF